jgi:hypothetical protein
MINAKEEHEIAKHLLGIAKDRAHFAKVLLIFAKDYVNQQKTSLK